MEYLRMFRLFNVNVRAVIIYAVMEGLVFGIFRLLFNFYVRSLPGYDNSFLGNLTSIQSLAALLVSMPAVWVVGKVPTKPIMLISGLAQAIALLGIVMFPYRPVFIAGNIIGGISFAFRGVASAPFMMANTSSTERQYAFSFAFGLQLIAEFIGLTLGGILPTLFAGLILVEPTSTPAYQMAIGSAGIVAALAVLPLLLIDERYKVKLPELDWGNLRKYAPQISRLLASPFAIGLGAGLMVPFFNIYFRDVYGQPDAAIGLVSGLAVFGMALGQLVSPPIAGRIGKINTVLLTQGMSIPFLMTMGLGAYLVPAGLGDAHVWFLIAAVVFILRNTLMNLSQPVYQTFVLEHVDPEAMALTTSLNGMAFTIGWFVSPSVSGWLQDTYQPFGFVPIYAATAVLYMIGTVILYTFFGKTEREEKAAALAAGAK